MNRVTKILNSNQEKDTKIALFQQYEQSNKNLELKSREIQK